MAATLVKRSRNEVLSLTLKNKQILLKGFPQKWCGYINFVTEQGKPD